jgi:hypothetical protein
MSKHEKVETAKENNAFILLTYYLEAPMKIMYHLNNKLPAIPITENSTEVKYVCSS